MSDWLELELAERLAPVRAPEALWARVNQAAASSAISHPKPRPIAWAWVMASAILAAIVAVTFAIPSPSLSQLAAAELAKSRDQEFQSTDPHEIARWLRSNAAVELSIPNTTKVQFTGARAIDHNGQRIGEVRYRVAGADAILLVGRAGVLDGPTRHGQPTWKAHGQVYALAYAVPAQSRLACQLCHID
jgi:hypothetical protein